MRMRRSRNFPLPSMTQAYFATAKVLQTQHYDVFCLADLTDGGKTKQFIKFRFSHEKKCCSPTSFFFLTYFATSIFLIFCDKDRQYCMAHFRIPPPCLWNIFFQNSIVFLWDYNSHVQKCIDHHQKSSVGSLLQCRTLSQQ